MWLLMTAGVVINLLSSVAVLPWWTVIVGACLVVSALWLYLKARRASG
jgi:hypothetical protein